MKYIITYTIGNDTKDKIVETKQALRVFLKTLDNDPNCDSYIVHDERGETQVETDKDKGDSEEQATGDYLREQLQRRTAELHKMIWLVARQSECFQEKNKGMNKIECPTFGPFMAEKDHRTIAEMCYKCIEKWVQAKETDEG